MSKGVSSLKWPWKIKILSLISLSTFIFTCLFYRGKMGDSCAHNSLCQFTHCTTCAFVHSWNSWTKLMKDGGSNKLPGPRSHEMKNHAGGAPWNIPESATTPWFHGNPPDAEHVSHTAAFIWLLNTVLPVEDHKSLIYCWNEPMSITTMTSFKRITKNCILSKLTIHTCLKALWWGQRSWLMAATMPAPPSLVFHPGRASSFMVFNPIALLQPLLRHSSS